MTRCGSSHAAPIKKTARPREKVVPWQCLPVRQVGAHLANESFAISDKDAPPPILTMMIGGRLMFVSIGGTKFWHRKIAIVLAANLIKDVTLFKKQIESLRRIYVRPSFARSRIAARYFSLS